MNQAISQVRMGWEESVRNLARVLLIGYAVVLPIRGTAALQSTLLLSGFMGLIVAEHGQWNRIWPYWRDSARPLILFSLWILMTCFFWKPPEYHEWDPASLSVKQPMFSLNLWRRDILQPMVALVCAAWGFRHMDWRRGLFLSQGVLLMALLMMALSQYFVGEFHGDILNFGTLQVRGLSRDNIFFSYVLFLLTPAAVWLVLNPKPGWANWFSWLMLLVLFFLIFLNKRRGTWMAVYVELLFIAWWLGRKYFVTFFLGSLIFLGSAVALRPQWFQRDYDTQQTGRIEIMKDVFPLIERHPWLGVGFGKDTVVKHYWHEIYQHAHNNFANVAIELGIPGLVLWLGVLGAYALRFWRNRDSGWGARLGFAFVIGFCVRNLTDDVWISSNAELFWLTTGVLLSEIEVRR